MTSESLKVNEICAAGAAKKAKLVIDSVQTKLKNRFSLFPREKFNFDYRRPQEIGYFSLDINRQILFDKSRLRYYTFSSYSDVVRFDLNIGYEKMIKKNDEKKEYIDHILYWILENCNGSSSIPLPGPTINNSPPDQNQSSANHQQKTTFKNSSNLNTDFVCWRGLLTKLVCTPYENQEGWLLAVTRFNDTFYLCEFETEEKKSMEANRTEFHKQTCYGGWKFEQYVTANEPNGKPDTSSAVNNCEAYCTVVKTQFNSHSLLFSGEIDCIDSKGNYVELKTNRELYNSHHHQTFKRFKLLKWWAQSFLIGVPKIISGFRDETGVVGRLEEFNTLKIPKSAYVYEKPLWEPNICFNFLDQFLSFIKDTIKTNDHRNVHLFRRNPKSNEISWQDLGTHSEFQFLPQWYIDKFLI